MIFFQSKKLNRKKNKKIFENVKQRILSENIVGIVCPECKTNIWNFSYDYLHKYKKVYCAKCDDFSSVNIEFKLKWKEEFLKINKALSEDDVLKFFIENTSIEQKSSK